MTRVCGYEYVVVIDFIIEVKPPLATHVIWFNIIINSVKTVVTRKMGYYLGVFNPKLHTAKNIQQYNDIPDLNVVESPAAWTRAAAIFVTARIVRAKS